MATVEFRPGDTLNIIWSSVQDTPLGVKKVESSFAFSYDDLLTRLRNKGNLSKSRKSASHGARFSRVIALSTNALKKGKWSTGADIERVKVFKKLISNFNELASNEYKNITATARLSLQKLFDSQGLITANQKKELQAMIKTINDHISSP